MRGQFSLRGEEGRRECEGQRTAAAVPVVLGAVRQYEYIFEGVYLHVPEHVEVRCVINQLPLLLKHHPPRGAGLGRVCLSAAGEGGKGGFSLERREGG